MKVEIKIDEAARETKVIVIAKEMTQEVQSLLARIGEERPQVLAGFDGDTVHLLEQKEILRIYASAGKVLAQTGQGTYTLRLRLYELEERLDRGMFVRISHSEILNLRRVKGFDLSFTGTICVTLTDGTVTYVSRRYVGKIKQVLGL